MSLIRTTMKSTQVKLSTIAEAILCCNRKHRGCLASIKIQLWLVSKKKTHFFIVLFQLLNFFFFLFFSFAHQMQLSVPKVSSDIGFKIVKHLNQVVYFNLLYFVVQSLCCLFKFYLHLEPISNVLNFLSFHREYL